MRAWAFVVGIALCGCEPSELPRVGQIVLGVATDAPLPAEGGNVSIDEPTPLFDTARISIYEPPPATEPCAGCTRDFELVAGRPASMGIVTKPGVSGYRARVTVFRAIAVRDGEPIPSARLETVIELPAAPEEGAIEVTAWLPTDTVGVPVGSIDAPVAPQPGPPDPHPALWPPAQRRLCTIPTGPGEVCIPGGAFWMGHIEQPYDKQPWLRLVALSPFILDATEVSVASFRASGLVEFGVNGGDPALSSGQTSGLDLHDWCTFTLAAGPNEALPVNCVSWPKAREYCLKRGSDLPSEAQQEYVMGALASQPLVWGLELPSCEDAVLARRGVGLLGGSGCDTCLPQGTIGGPAPAGFGLRDRLTIGGATVVDLTGNISEWSADVWQLADESCWTQTLLHDPVCAEPSAAQPGARTLRGGTWGYCGWGAHSNTRHFSPEAEGGPLNGFRCARPGVVP